MDSATGPVSFVRYSASSPQTTSYPVSLNLEQPLSENDIRTETTAFVKMLKQALLEQYSYSADGLNSIFKHTDQWHFSNWDLTNSSVVVKPNVDAVDYDTTTSAVVVWNKKVQLPSNIVLPKIYKTPQYTKNGVVYKAKNTISDFSKEEISKMISLNYNNLNLSELNIEINGDSIKLTPKTNSVYVLMGSPGPELITNLVDASTLTSDKVFLSKGNTATLTLKHRGEGIGITGYKIEEATGYNVSPDGYETQRRPINITKDGISGQIATLSISGQKLKFNYITELSEGVSFTIVAKYKIEGTKETQLGDANKNYEDYKDLEYEAKCTIALNGKMAKFSELKPIDNPTKSKNTDIAAEAKINNIFGLNKNLEYLTADFIDNHKGSTTPTDYIAPDKRLKIYLNDKKETPLLSFYEYLLANNGIDTVNNQSSAYKSKNILNLDKINYVNGVDDKTHFLSIKEGEIRYEYNLSEFYSGQFESPIKNFSQGSHFAFFRKLETKEDTNRSAKKINNTVNEFSFKENDLIISNVDCRGFIDIDPNSRPPFYRVKSSNMIAKYIGNKFKIKCSRAQTKGYVYEPEDIERNRENGDILWLDESGYGPYSHLNSMYFSNSNIMRTARLTSAPDQNNEYDFEKRSTPIEYAAKRYFRITNSADLILHIQLVNVYGVIVPDNFKYIHIPGYFN